MITQKHLYPITIIPGLKNKERDLLIDNNYIFCQDLVKRDFNKIKKDLSLASWQINRLINQAQQFVNHK